MQSKRPHFILLLLSLLVSGPIGMCLAGPGDVDADGDVDIEDARYIARSLVNQGPPVFSVAVADANEDGTVDIEDAFTIAKHVSGESRILLIDPEGGGSPDLKVGDLLRVQVMEKFFPSTSVGWTVRIRSSTTSYDSGPQSLIQSADQRSMYFLWNVAGVQPALDYIVSFQLGTQVIDVTIALGQPNFGPSSLADFTDAGAPAPGMPLAFRRYISHDPYSFPYLGALGRGWMHSFDVFLEEFPDGTVRFHGPSPAPLARVFKSLPNGSFESAPGDHSVLSLQGDNTFQLREKNGFKMRFLANGKLHYMEDRNGNRITLSYDGNGRMVQASHTTGDSLAFAYNAAGRMQCVTDPSGRITQYLYDTTGQLLIKVIDPSLAETTYTYTQGRNYLVNQRLESITYPDNTGVQYQFDDSARVVSQAGLGGLSPITYLYEAGGITKIQNATGAQTSVQYNERGLPVQITDATGGVSLRQYDALFNLISTTDPLNRTSTFSYDARGNLTQTTLPGGSTLIFEYEPVFNQLTKLTDANSQVTTFEHDAAGNLTRITYPNTSTEEFTYLPNGTLATQTNRAGQTTSFTRNARGLVSAKNLPGGVTHTFSYDASGNLTSASTSSWTFTQQFDLMNRLTQVTYPGSRSFHYTYDSSSVLIRVEDPDGRKQRYEYDDMRRLERIVDEPAETPVVTYLYDAAGRRIKRTSGNGVVTDYTYDLLDRVDEIVNRGPGGNVISRFDYAYDAAGNVTSRQRVSGTDTFGYDPNLGRLNVATFAGGDTESFAYDAAGNRTLSVRNGVSTPYTTNPMNQYTSAGGTTCTYDANGNLATEVTTGGTTQYVYDAENHLIQVITPTETISYEYDALGRRVRRSQSSTGMSVFLMDREQVAIEQSVSSQTIARFLWGEHIDEVLRMEKTAGTYFYSQDAQFSVFDVTDAVGSVIEQYTYTAYGLPSVPSGVGNRFFYTGLDFDFTTKLQYSRHRVYRPNLGRFVQPDPAGLSASVNLYEYANNNPLRFSDPLGLMTTEQADAVATLQMDLFQAITAPSFVTIGQASFSVLGVYGAYNLPTATNTASGGLLFAGIAGFASGKAQADPIGLAISSATAGIIGASRHVIGGRNSSSGGGGRSGGMPMIVNARGSWAPAGYGWTNLSASMCPTFIQPSPGNKITTTPAQTDPQSKTVFAKILVPPQNCLMRCDIPVFGFASGSKFQRFVVQYGKGSNPVSWHDIDSSTLPQTKCRSFSDLSWMTGDLNLIGNLATWNTGLKNWEHLPAHPVSDPTDFNGVYTIRLLVEGKDGTQAEDRVTGEIGRAIAQCIPGIALSPDGRLVMHFPEHALTTEFRVYSIQLLADVNEAMPALPEGVSLIGTAYRIREPGDAFIKPVRLEMKVPEGHAVARPEQVGVAHWDAEKGTWNWLETESSEAGRSFSTILRKLPPQKAIFALLVDQQTPRSKAAAPQGGETMAQVPPVRAGVLIDNRFESGLGTVSERDAPVGAALKLVKGSPDSSQCLEMTNTLFGGTFGVTLCKQPFNVEEYPELRFEYMSEPGVSLNLYVKCEGRWYCMVLTGKEPDFHERDVNMTVAGMVPHARADGRWHQARVNLATLLATKTRHTQVQEIMLADWATKGYMKLAFGQNKRGARFWMDNLVIEAPAGYSRPNDSRRELIVDAYNDPAPTNDLGGATGELSWREDVHVCEARVVSEAAQDGHLRLSFDVSQQGAFGGYWTHLGDISVRGLDVLEFDVRSPQAVMPRLKVAVKDNGGREFKLDISRFAGRDFKTREWLHVRIPVTMFGSVIDLSAVASLSMIIEHSSGLNRGELDVDNIRFAKGELPDIKLADFQDKDPNANLLGRENSTFEDGAAAINVKVRDDEVAGSENPSLLLAYGGTIGHDFSNGGFSFCGFRMNTGRLDLSNYQTLRFKIRGMKGGEQPNVYLIDGFGKRMVDLENYHKVTTSWGSVTIPLADIAAKGLDLTHVRGLEFTFEWQNESSSIWMDDLTFSAQPLKVAGQPPLRSP